MAFYDSHLHIGNLKICSHILKNSTYKHKYKLYSSIDERILGKQEEYIKKLDGFFAIPLFFKESDIKNCNDYLIKYCLNCEKAIPVLLIDSNENFKIEDCRTPIFKEHFLLHNSNEYQSRSLYYDYLHNNNGYLLLHCKDSIRKEYVRNLLSNHYKMNIIIAHLGRDTFESESFIHDIVGAFVNNNNVLFDISTIHNIENVKMAIEKIGSERLLYGTDFPFEYNDLNDIEDQRKSLISHLPFSDVENIFEKNFERIRKRINGPK